MESDEEHVLTQLRRGTLEHCILGALQDQARYGLEIAEMLGRDGAILSSEGVLYPTLSRLRRTGLIESTWQESPVGPPRRYYSLTAAGKQTLAIFVGTWAKFSASVSQALEGKS